MSQGLATTVPIRTRHRATIVAVGLLVVLAIGVGALVLAVASGGSQRSVERVAPAAAPVPPPVRLCGHDATNLLAAFATMSPFIQAHVVGNLSRPIADGLGHLALMVDASALPPPPDATTLGGILTRLDRGDRLAILEGLPDEQAAAAAAAWQSASTAEYVSSTATACS